MSYGKMNTFIDIISFSPVKDAEGFSSASDSIVASVRAYREGRHGSQKWANRAAFSDATDLFSFRIIPGVTITTSHVLACGDGRFDIVSVENVKGRDIYVEVLAKRTEAARGKG